MGAKRNKRAAFTLVELIIVIIILGILAALAIPQFATSTQDAQIATLQSNLAVARNAVNLYYHQHNSTYPCVNDETGGAGGGGTGIDDPALVQQLEQYSNVNGATTNSLNRTTHPFGPYFMNGIPDNPMTGTNTVYIFAEPAPLDAADVTTALAADANCAWIYSKTTGEWRACNATYLTY